MALALPTAHQEGSSMTSSSPPVLRFLEDGTQCEYEKARVAILPVPHEATVSYGRGTAGGPAAILRASTQLELYDEQLRREPYRCGIWTDLPLELPAGDGERAIEVLARRFGELLDAGKWVVMLGGEHSITTGGVRAAAARSDGLVVVQLDAHADLRDSYEGDRWSHASAMARCLEIAPVHAIGVRSYSAEEGERIRRGLRGYQLTHAWEMRDEVWIEIVLEEIRGRPVYLTVDVDYFDPALIPATGTPEPGGGAWWPTLRFLEQLFCAARVVACDVVELAPLPGLHHADFTVARLVHKLIGFAGGTSFPAPQPAGEGAA
jgi:agmatinase